MIFPSLELINPSVFDRNCGCGHKITSKACQGGKRQMGPPRTELGICPNLWHCVSSELVYPPKKNAIKRVLFVWKIMNVFLHACRPLLNLGSRLPNPQNQSFSQSTGSTVLYRPEAQNFGDLMRAVMGRSPRFVGSQPVGVGPAAEFILECVQKSWSTLPRRFPSDHPEAWPEIKSTGWQYQYIMRYQYIYIYVYSFNIIKVISWYDMRSHDGIWYGAICNAICVDRFDQYNETFTCANVNHVCACFSTSDPCTTQQTCSVLKTWLTRNKLQKLKTHCEITQRRPSLFGTEFLGFLSKVGSSEDLESKVASGSKSSRRLVLGNRRKPFRPKSDPILQGFNVVLLNSHPDHQSRMLCMMREN